MIIIDGSFGEGGGQIFRSALALSLCTGKAVRIENIRAGRNKPGLLRQHLTCLQAAKAISNAEVRGGELGSSCVEFNPREVRAGRYNFAIGSAGSTSLVFQTVFLPLALAGDSELYLEGGTHNDHAPSFDFLEKCFLPIMHKLGFEVEVQLERFGFYPAGGGAWSARINRATQFTPLALAERGELVNCSAVVTYSQLPVSVADRELDHIHKCWPLSIAQCRKRPVRSVGPGNIVSLRANFEYCCEIVEAVGTKGVAAERVAGNAVSAMKRYLDSGAVVGEYLADQLLLPLALTCGGSFTMVKPSQHFLTNVAVIQQFINSDVRVGQISENNFEVFVAAG